MSGCRCTVHVCLHPKQREPRTGALVLLNETDRSTGLQRSQRALRHLDRLAERVQMLRR